MVRGRRRKRSASETVRTVVESGLPGVTEREVGGGRERELIQAPRRMSGVARPRGKFPPSRANGVTDVYANGDPREIFLTSDIPNWPLGGSPSHPPTKPTEPV